MFGLGFLDRASKIVETEKAFDKVSDSGPSYKRSRMENSKDLRSFLSKGPWLLEVVKGYLLELVAQPTQSTLQQQQPIGGAPAEESSGSSVTIRGPVIEQDFLGSLEGWVLLTSTQPAASL